MTIVSRAVSLNENVKLESSSKDLFVSIAKWLSGKELDDLQLEGTDAQINAIKEAMEASMDFQKELLKADSTLKSVTEKLQAKLSAAETFEKELGVQWIL